MSGETEKKPKHRPMVDPDLIRELARLLDETGLTEIEFERDGERVRVARQAQVVQRRAGGAGGAAYRCAIPERPDRSGQASGPRHLAHGRHRLCRRGARGAAVRRGRQPRAPSATRC